ncbi:hypothetical protein JDV02_010862 [Purpureocillium takamizusanense]|uniref:Uncharacterized protein n=1 Tax=Purpureocillium takamizusanense TaxID=2060973 RepID=A0A9Q8QL75_9HYPO|nr:uncharacterized protein JDV02_010862 [Purpureocillium takamizusanense]UNI20572.1 hypothetical protein JDV02_010862 [Purpureocillium takamizusanense]
MSLHSATCSSAPDPSRARAHHRQLRLRPCPPRLPLHRQGPIRPKEGAFAFFSQCHDIGEGMEGLVLLQLAPGGPRPLLTLVGRRGCRVYAAHDCEAQKGPPPAMPSRTWRHPSEVFFCERAVTSESGGIIKSSSPVGSCFLELRPGFGGAGSLGRAEEGGGGGDPGGALAGSLARLPSTAPAPAPAARL